MMIVHTDSKEMIRLECESILPRKVQEQQAIICPRLEGVALPDGLPGTQYEKPTLELVTLANLRTQQKLLCCNVESEDIV